MHSREMLSAPLLLLRKNSKKQVATHAGSSRLVELIEKVATADSITPTQRQIFVNVLLNTASFAATRAPTPNFQVKQTLKIGRIQLPPAVIADTRIEESFAKIRAAISENNGGVVRESIDQLASAESPKLDTDRQFKPTNLLNQVL